MNRSGFRRLGAIRCAALIFLSAPSAYADDTRTAIDAVHARAAVGCAVDHCFDQTTTWSTGEATVMSTEIRPAD